MLKIENYSKYYGEKLTVDNLSLHIKKGEIYGFIGHNGAGKTTTIKSVIGILEFEKGDIYIDGMSIKEKPLECKKIISYIPDNPDLYDYMTGMQYLNFVGDVFLVPQDKRKELIDIYSQKFGISDDLSQSIGSFSHGMKQKLAIIGALIHEPKLMIMDEPFVGLDPIATHEFKMIMREMCDKGCAVFFSTHVLEVAEKLCDSVAIIKNGRLVSSGKMEEIKGDSSLESVFLELEA